MEKKESSSFKQELKKTSKISKDAAKVKPKRKNKDRRAQKTKDRRNSSASDRRQSLAGYRSESLEHDRRNPALLDRRDSVSSDRRTRVRDRRLPSDSFKSVKKFLITGAYIGYSPYMPGTLASAAVVLVYGLSVMILPFAIVTTLHTLFILMSLIIGYKLSGYASTVLFQDSDPKQMVLDEIAGMSISLIPFMFLNPITISTGRLIIYLGVAFIMFRVLDIFKPGLIGRLDKQYATHYVMNDDIVAGVITALLVNLLITL